MQPDLPSDVNTPERGGGDPTSDGNTLVERTDSNQHMIWVKSSYHAETNMMLGWAGLVWMTYLSIGNLVQFGFDY
jgi:hypothetical protein